MSCTALPAGRRRSPQGNFTTDDPFTEVLRDAVTGERHSDQKRTICKVRLSLLQDDVGLTRLNFIGILKPES